MRWQREPLTARVDVLAARVDELFSIATVQAAYLSEVRDRLTELNAADEWLSRLLAKMRTDPDR